MDQLLRPDQEELIIRVAKENGIIKPEIQAEVGTSKGDNYLSAILCVTVRDGQGDKKLDIIVKKVLTGGETGQTAKKLNQLFSTETMVYRDLLPAYRKLQEENGVKDPFRGSSVFYGAILDEQKETILLQNLKEDGFRLWPRQVPMDHAHAEIVIREYGKLHAASMAFKSYYPERFEEYANKIGTLKDEGDKGDEWFGKAIADFKTMFDNRGEIQMSVEKFMKNLKSFKDDMPKEKQVFLHGDCWCNNILYKYEDPGSPNPTRVCFIDWQLTRTGSPVLDIAYFFVINSSKEVLNDYERYLRLYHDALSQNLNEMGLDPQEIFSFETLTDHWKKYAKFGLLMSILLLKVLICESEDISMNADGVKIELSGDANERFKERITYVMEFMAQNDLA